jgi:4-amino-4-deoxy-L-arabinose transferase-like glycosyltransferase
MARRRKIADATWSRLALGLVAAFVVLHLGFNALGLVPAHFDEAQYWTWSNAPALGYYSKPPLVAWAIALSTGVFGDTLFGLRFFAPLCHAGIVWLIFSSARRLFDARTGFWAAAAWAAAPGVTVSAGLMTTDAPMMLGWALAFRALVAIVTARRGKGAPERRDPEPRGLWVLLGAALGVAMLAKYTALAFAAGGLGHALFSRAGPLRWRGAALALLVALLVLSPHLVWLAGNGFPSVAHLAENAGEGPRFTPELLADFLATQAGVIGPVLFAALVWALWRRGAWLGDWRMRLLAWLAAPLLLAMAAQALRGGANANWAAPAYIAGAILAARWLLERGYPGALRLHLLLGAAVVVLLWSLAAVYGAYATGLPRLADPWKKSRLGGTFCELVVGAMEETGAEIVLSNDRRRLAECSFEGGLAPDQIRVWNPDGTVANHYEMTASLAAGEERPMILAVIARDGADEAVRFEEAELIDDGVVVTHLDRDYPFAIWLVRGFRGY